MPRIICETRGDSALAPSYCEVDLKGDLVTRLLLFGDNFKGARHLLDELKKFVLVDDEGVAKWGYIDPATVEDDPVIEPGEWYRMPDGLEVNTADDDRLQNLECVISEYGVCWAGWVKHDAAGYFESELIPWATLEALNETGRFDFPTF